MLNDNTIINVVINGNGCYCNCTKKCKKKAKYSIFLDDGILKSSRLHFTSCSNPKHLALGIKKSWEINHKNRIKVKKKKQELSEYFGGTKCYASADN